MMIILIVRQKNAMIPLPSHTLLRCTPSLLVLTHVADSHSPSDSYIIMCDSHLKKRMLRNIPLTMPCIQHVAYCCTHTLFVDHPSSSGPRGRCSCCTCQRPITCQAIQYRRRSPTTRAIKNGAGRKSRHPG